MKIRILAVKFLLYIWLNSVWIPSSSFALSSRICFSLFATATNHITIVGLKHSNQQLITAYGCACNEEIWIWLWCRASVWSVKIIKLLSSHLFSMCAFGITFIHIDARHYWTAKRPNFFTQKPWYFPIVYQAPNDYRCSSSLCAVSLCCYLALRMLPRSAKDTAQSHETAAHLQCIAKAQLEGCIILYSEYQCLKWTCSRNIRRLRGCRCARSFGM